MNIFLRENYLYFWILAFSSLLIAINIYPVLGPDLLAGWDTPGHYVLYKNAINNLKTSTIFSYENYWFGGYPLFHLYPPLFYLVTALTYISLANFFTDIEVFNFFIFLIPIAFIHSVGFAAKEIFNPKVRNLCLIITTISLFVSTRYAAMNIGLVGHIYTGLISSTFGLCLYFYFLGLLYKAKKLPQYILLGLLLAATISSHFIIGIFAIATLFFWIILNFRDSIKFIPTFIVSSLICLPWIRLIFRNLQYNSGTKIGYDDFSISDPILSIFPNMDYKVLKALFDNPFEVSITKINFLNLLDITVGFYKIIANFPYAGFILCLGIFFYCKLGDFNKNKFISLFTLLSVLFLPRNIFSSMFEVNLHYYRFVQPIYALVALLAARGWYSAYERILTIKNIKVNSFLKVLTVCLIFLSLIFSSIYSLDWNKNKDSKNNFAFKLKNYSMNTESDEIIEYLNSQSLGGRVAYEIDTDNMKNYGSPHLYSALFPLNNIESLPGLLAESSYSSGFITPILGIIGEHLIWGRRELLLYQAYYRISIDGAINRLSLYNTEYLLGSSEKFYTNLKNSKLVQQVFNTKNQYLFKIKKFDSKLYELSESPYLYINLGNINFRDFSETWYLDDDNLNSPIIFTDKDISEIPHKELSRIKGFVISINDNTDWEKIDLLHKINPNIILLSEKEIKYKKTKYLNIKNNLTRKGELSGSLKFTGIKSPLKPIEISNERISFTSSKGVVINYNFAPGWVSDSNQTTYQVTPSLMFVFSDGTTSLQYK